MSRPMRARGLKQAKGGEQGDGEVSRPMRARGLRLAQLERSS